MQAWKFSARNPPDVNRDKSGASGFVNHQLTDEIPIGKKLRKCVLLYMQFLTGKMFGIIYKIETKETKAAGVTNIEERIIEIQ